jgi:UDP-N-acetylmuramyl pentapeptide phosphotransferase/UDP-N-acetylglucosamine-1-phosphate transferase
MIEPQQAHYRAEFRRLCRYQALTVIGGFFAALGFGAVIVLVSPPEWVQWLAVPLVFVGIGAIGLLEVRKTLVFRRDLRERRAERTEP